MTQMLEAGNEVLTKHQLKRVTYSELIDLKSLPIKDKCKKLGIPWIKLPQYIIELVNKLRDKGALIKPFEGINELITYLNQRFELAIITSNSIELVEAFLENNHIQCFSQIESSNGLLGKDAAIKKFLKSNNLKSDEVIYVGDEIRDIIACKKVGVKIISVTWGYDSHSLLATGNPNYLVTKPEEIKGIVNLGS
jgi:phosphoglycolate phosphatase